ncbi:MAG: penicillin-binding protein [Cyclobacteriaceae bacterium]|nr:penicillin-binding protein [Cyclobacteriaceae bacterium]
MSRLSDYYFIIIQFLKSPWSWKKGFILLGTVLTAMIVGIFFLFILIWTGALGSLPNKEELSLLENPTASEVYSADSVLLGQYFIQERSNIRYEDLSPSAINALLATEDVRFYEHGAIDKRSLGRVFVKSLLFQQESSGGGSTLTQQLAKNLYPRRSYWVGSLVINKIREMIVASRLEKVYDKNEILTLYLNTISFGENTYGLESASRRFFSRSAKELSIDQSATLIGMLKATNYYNPRLSPERSLHRRNVVLEQMRKYDFITQEALDTLITRPIILDYRSINHHTGLAPYFRDYIREELVTWCNEYNSTHDKPLQLYTSGLKIYTTIDSRLQQYAEDAMQNQMTAIQKKFQQQWGKSDPLPIESSIVQNALKKSAHYQSLKAQGHSHDEIISLLKVPTNMNILTVDGEKEMMMSPIDSIRHYLKFLSAGLLAMDPRDGSVRVWIGGTNHEYFQFDHIHESTKRQVGSTFKPIVYAAALEQGMDPCDYISAGKTTYTNMEDWAPKNSGDNYERKYSMGGALAYSVNTVSVRVLEKAGIGNTISLARRMGIKSTLPAVPSIALGTADISMIELVSAYTGFANQGNVVKPYYITSITTHQNEVLESYKASPSTRALSSENAQLILHMLRNAVNEGTSSSLRSQFGLTNDIGGKTGTTQSNTDGWFMAITPKLVIGSWVGADQPLLHFKSTSMGQGARTALPIVGEFLQHVNRDKDLSSIAYARFPDLSSDLQRKLSCESFKSDKNIFNRIFGTSRKEKKRDFGKPAKKGFFKKLLGKS